ncbi:MAG: ATM1-type heavy metal exporter [Paracidovorax wautersii]|uniref:ATM1-type heavy metal exporter n=1 Tax=Paracidovorax wautersii TaxID=1177982 RepID=A0A7V8FLD5_9BURK|nr:MAG: ATM1-type heavy metal exporter [Paracidovorax wautersii]
MIYQYAQQTASVVSTMAGNFQNFARMSTDYSSADLIWELPAPAPAPQAGADAGTPGWQSLAIDGLHWDYPRPTTADPAQKTDTGPRGGLHDVQLELARGRRIALVGASGGGKSTLLRVLAGLYAPRDGTLARDGQPLPWTELAGMATLIPQESEIFEASVRENLTFGEPVPEAALDAALHTSAFDDVLARLGQGLATPLSERGFNLSGGQRQRLNLARGLLAARDSSLLLLDEPTSALDAATEARVFERIATAFGHACIVASIHRLSLLDRFDAIVLMDAGRVADAGPRDEVLQRQPLLRQLASAPPAPPKSAPLPPAAPPVDPFAEAPSPA